MNADAGMDEIKDRCISSLRKEKIRSSRTRTRRASTLFYTKRSGVSRIRTITDTDTGEEQRTGVVPTLV